MKRFCLFATLLATACTTGMTGGPPPPPAACGTATGALTGSLSGCQAVSIDFMSTSRITLTNLGFIDDEGNLATTTIQLGSLVGEGSYAMGTAVKSYSSTLTRVEDERQYVIAYDSTDKTKTAGSMTLAVNSLAPDANSSAELDLTGHYSAVYVPPAGATYTDTVTVAIDF